MQNFVKKNVSELKRDKTQPRQAFDEGAIRRLATSIKREGIIEPVIIDHKNVIIIGERRWQAAKKAGIQLVPTLTTTVTDQERLALQVSEEMHKEDWKPTERGDAFKRLIDYGYSLRDIETKFGVDKDTISIYTGLLDEDKELRDAIDEGKVGVTFAREIKKVKDEATRKKVQEKVITGGFQTRDELSTTVGALNETDATLEELQDIDYHKEITTLLDQVWILLSSPESTRTFSDEQKQSLADKWNRTRGVAEEMFQSWMKKKQ